MSAPQTPPGYPTQPAHQTQSGYPTQPGQPAQPGYQTAPGQPAQPGYQAQPGYGPGPAGQYGWQPLPQAPKPGIIPLRPLGLGDILSGAFAAISKNPLVNIVMPLLLGLVTAVVGIAVGLPLASPLNNWLTSIVSYRVAAEFTAAGMPIAEIAAIYAVTIACGLALIVTAPIIAGLVTVSTSRSVIGEKALASQVWERFRPRLGATIGWHLLIAALGVLGAALVGGIIAVTVSLTAPVAAPVAILLAILFYFAAVVLSIWVSTKIILSTPAVVLENTSMGKAAAHGWNLSKGLFWRILGITILASLIASVALSAVSGGFSIAMGAIAFTGSWTGISVLIAALVGIIGALSLVLTSAVAALLYIDARIRKEGLAESLLAAANALHAPAHTQPSTPGPVADPTQPGPDSSL
jgi:hypothetical protein